MELGIYSFVENTPLAGNGETRSARQRLTDLLEEITLADQAGLDVYAIGEHHRKEYLASAPAVILAAAASRTKSIRLSSAVTVLGSEDPVRVFQQFATLDLLSDGRAEIMAGRGSFTESFPLFGYDLQQYDELFSEKLELLLALSEKEVISWSGRHRPDIPNRGIYPRPLQDRMPVWVAVGGTPQSAVRTGSLGLPMAIAIIGGDPRQFVPMAALHRESATRNGHPEPALSINSHGFIARDSQTAKNLAWPAFELTMNRIGKERGWPPMTREQFEASCTRHGANMVGSPAEITEKILYQHEQFKHQRFLLQLTVGSISHKEVMESIELLGTKVAPAVRKALGHSESSGITRIEK